MEDDKVYPEDVLPGEAAHAAAVRIRYGLVVCLVCGWPVLVRMLDRYGVCAWCLAALTENDQT